MAYTRNNNSNKYSKNNKPQGPKNKAMTFSIQLSGVNANGREYKTDSARDIFQDLSSADIFSKISIPMQISRAIVDGNPETRGNTIIGFVTGIDVTKDEIDVMVYGRSVETIESIDGLYCVPRMVIDRDGNVTTILGFDLTNA